MEREAWSNRLGFLLAAIGGSIGLGNVWRFPYVVGRMGGGAFLITFLLLLLSLGVIGVRTELGFGRAMQGGPLTAIRGTPLPGRTVWSILPPLIFLILMSYYLVVIGWISKYFVASFSQAFWQADAAEYFAHFISGDPTRFVFHGAAVFIPASIVVLGLNKGIERTARIAVPLLFSILIAMAVRILMLPGALSGMEFFLKPDFSGFSGETILAALGQVFFSIGLGSACLILYGSYLKPDVDIPRNSIIICLGEAVAAVLAGLVVFPALFAFGQAPTSGPALIFLALPKIFSQMPGGHIFALFFFGGVLIACLTPALFGLEFFVEPLIHLFGWKRNRAVAASAISLWVLGIPACWNIDILKRIDLAISNVFLPICALITPIAFLWFYGQQKAIKSINAGARKPLRMGWLRAARIIYPIMIAIVLVWGIFTNIL